MDSEMKIVWSYKARITFFKILDYLNENWTIKEVTRFYKKTRIILDVINKNPEIFSPSEKNIEIRKAFIDKNNSLFYKIDSYNHKIYLLTFFDNRLDPKRFFKN